MSVEAGGDQTATGHCDGGPTETPPAPPPRAERRLERGPVRITVAYNLRTDSSEDSAELLTQEDVDRITGARGE